MVSLESRHIFSNNASNERIGFLLYKKKMADEYVYVQPNK